MRDCVIHVDNLSKRFRIGAQETHHRVSELIYGLGRRVITTPARWMARGEDHTPGSASGDEDFWALRDISFEIARGEAIGVIGRNGAGKSTLLKILSRITEPTQGRFGVRGRVSSLLEVGTGFHPELTGRENVFLNGAFLGMSRADIRRQFDEIAAFAEVDQFLDTPVKRYSSGMKIRLGFAVAAHLQPEVMIVDEVLSVGDAAFQKKCLEKMNDVVEGGRTILFVSHNTAAISRFCQRAILLEHGKVRMDGDVDEVIEVYEGAGPALPGGKSIDEWDAQSRPTPFFQELHINDTPFPGRAIVRPGEPLRVALRGDVRGAPRANVWVAVYLSSTEGVRLLTLSPQLSGHKGFDVSNSLDLSCHTEPIPLVPGVYHVDVVAGHKGGRLDTLSQVGSVVVDGSDTVWPGVAPRYKHQGYFVANSEWLVQGSEARS